MNLKNIVPIAMTATIQGNERHLTPSEKHAYAVLSESHAYGFPEEWYSTEIRLLTQAALRISRQKRARSL
jgi:hypothetical protein